MIDLVFPKNALDPAPKFADLPTGAVFHCEGNIYLKCYRKPGAGENSTDYAVRMTTGEGHNFSNCTTVKPYDAKLILSEKANK